MKCFVLLSVIVGVFRAVLMERMFVYGTLKKGQPNNSLMTDSGNGRAEFLARARTVEKYPLVIATEDNIPFLLNVPRTGQNVPRTGQHVHGEIYSVDQKMLKFLDEFEECPRMYQRTTIKLKLLEELREEENTLKPGNVVEAFVYSSTTYEPEWLQKPTYESYDAEGDHGLKYVCHD